MAEASQNLIRRRDSMRNIRTYIDVIIGMIVFLFLSCGIAEYVVIKLIGG